LLFDSLVVGQVLAVNPAHAVRGSKHVVKRGKTPVLTEEQARHRLDNSDTSTLVGLRDRALIGVMTCSFARIGAVVAMRVEDYFPNGKRWRVRLHEKGGKRHVMPAHHKLEHCLDEYLAAAGIREDGKTPLFRSASGKTGTLTNGPMNRIDAYRMTRGRTAEAGFEVKLGCHVFRATGITAYLQAGGTLENAPAMAKPADDQAFTIALAMRSPSTRSSRSRFDKAYFPCPPLADSCGAPMNTALSRRQHRFESGRGRQSYQLYNGPFGTVG
jgi:integrase